MDGGTRESGTPWAAAPGRWPMRPDVRQWLNPAAIRDPTPLAGPSLVVVDGSVQTRASDGLGPLPPASRLLDTFPGEQVSSSRHGIMVPRFFAGNFLTCPLCQR
jgi:hypothetical protein